MKLALFDLDHTLLNIDSDHAWGEFLIAKQLVDEQRHRQKNDQFYQDYLTGSLDAVAYNEFVFEFLSSHDMDYLQQIHAEFMQEVIIPAMRPKGRDAILKHQQLGHQVVIITATNTFVTRPIASAFGVPDLIGSEPEIKDNRYTGRLNGEPCFQIGKLHHLERWLAAQSEAVTESWGYSDSFNDRFLLEYVNHAVTVNPDSRLHAHALAHGWPVEDWSLAELV